MSFVSGVFLGLIVGSIVASIAYGKRVKDLEDSNARFKKIVDTDIEIIQKHKEKEIVYERMIATHKEFIQKQRDYIIKTEKRIADLVGGKDAT